MRFLKILVAVTLICTLNTLLSAQDKPDGFASTSGNGVESTTGGEGGETVTVTTYENLRTYAGSSDPYIILVEGTIEQAKSTELNVASNKTIVGLGDSATLINIELHIIRKSNIIIRNLTVKENGWAEMSDGDGLQADNSNHIWIDHCHFSHNYDGCVDLRMVCDNITISWTKFSNHNKTLGIGWTEDSNFRTTIHHCWFDRVERRNPSFDMGIGHLYNNYLSDIGAYGNRARGVATVIIQNTVFENCPGPISIDDDASVYEKGNLFINSDKRSGNLSSMPYDPASFYAYSLDPVKQVRSVVTTGAGPQQFVSDQYTGQSASFKVVASVNGEYGTVTPDSANYAAGQQAMVTAVPEAGYQLDHWNIAVLGDANPASLIVTEDVKLIATFRVAQFEVAPDVVGRGSVSPASATYQIGKTANIEAIPDDNWIFDRWEGDVTGTENPTTLTVNNETNIIAHFKQVTATLQTNVVGNGTTTPVSEQFSVGDKVIVTATPDDENWVFDHWEGDLGGTTNPATVTVNKDLSITAHFKQIRFNVTTRVLKGKGSVDPENTDYNLGDQVTVTATPEEGWVFDHWTGHITGTENPVTFNIDQEMRITAFFVVDTETAASENTSSQKNPMSYFYSSNNHTLLVESKLKENVTISIISINGSLISQQQLASESNMFVPLNGLKNGVYLIRMESDSFKKTERFIVRN